MNFLYYKNFGEEKQVNYTTYKKKKFTPKKTHYRDDTAGHSESCECDVCSTQFPLRTHLMLDMSAYARLEQSAAASRRGNAGTTGTSSNTGFSLFGRYRKPLLTKEERRPSGSRVTNYLPGGIPDPMLPQKPQKTVAVPKKDPPVPLQEHVTLSTLKQDCIMVPMARMKRFYPAGHQIPTVGDPGMVRMLETKDPHLKIVFHMITQCKPLLPAMESPLFDGYKHQKECVIKAFETAAAAASCPQLQGMILMNLEKNLEEGKVEFPFMIVWIVDMLACDAVGVIKKVRQQSLEVLNPTRTGFTCGHYFDTYDEVVTLARPPLEKLSRRAKTPGTGYIITVFKVFDGDDGQKFERNWLTWTGAKTLYRSLSSDCDLRRFTLHKSSPQRGILHYVLLCDCSNFLSKISLAILAVPKLRMRLCGDIGLYRPIASL